MSLTNLVNNFINSWYFVIVILGTIFLLITKKAWNKLIEGLVIEIKNKFLNVKSTSQEQGKVNEATREETKDTDKFKKLLNKLNVENFDEFNELFEGKEKKIQEANETIKNLFELWRLYMFSYLNFYLVLNSKIALLWFHNNPNTTKDMFKLQIYIPPQVLKPELEKEAIFSALVSNSLIQKDNRDLYSLSNIGRDFLIFIGLIK